MALVTIDGRTFEVPDGENVIQAAARVGIDIPHYCYHPGLPIDGNCRMCLCEVEGLRGPQIACNTILRSRKDKDGNEYGFHGTFHEMSIDNMVQTFEFEGYPGHVSLDCMTLEELPGNRTKATIHSVFQSVADRDGIVQSGMENGVREGYERLDDILIRISK